MTRAPLLMAAAAALLLMVSAALLSRRREEFAYATLDAEDAPDWADNIMAAVSNAANVVTGSPVADMVPSDELLGMLKQGEALRLSRYRLGDGGWTIGYGRYYPDGGQLPPDRIDRDTAEAWFAEDVEARGAKWVRAYVSVPLQQHEFDALVHMAYNLKPSSFKTIAAAVNAGGDPEDAALQFVRAGSNLERGLRLRRGREIALYREGIYA